MCSVMGDSLNPATPPLIHHRSGRSPLAAALLIALGYYLGARLGFALTLPQVPVAPLWPPNAILLAGLWLTPLRSWPLTLACVFAAHLAVQFQSGVPAGMVLCWFVSNCTEALIGASLMRRFGGGRAAFETLRGTALFFCCAGFAAPFISSFIDSAFVVMNGWGNATYWTLWRVRFFSNALANLTLVPVIVATAHGLTPPRWPSRRRLAEALLGLVAIGGICWLVFVQQRPGPGTSPALLYAPMPLLVAAAVRFGPLGASASVLICALIAISGAVLGQGPFVTSSATANALSIQSFLIVAWIPVMSLAAVLRERGHAEQGARSSGQQLAMAIEAVQLGRWEWDIASSQLTWSDVTRRIYEVPLDVPVSPQTFEALVHPDDRGLLAAASADGLTRGGVDVEFRILFPDGRIKWILSKGKTVHDERGRPVRMIGVKVDVTDRKNAELLIQEQQRELAALSRVAVAGELSVALAHEVNQPLAAILANAGAARRFLLHNPPDLREIGEIVEAIADDNKRAAAVITRFGELLRKGDTRWVTLRINDVVSSVIDVARGDIISRGVSLTKSLGQGLPQVLGDAVQLQQVILNLIINACDAMDGVTPGERRLFVMTAADGQAGLRVTVSDSGEGVPDDRLEQIFEPFVTTKPQRLGLGLAICRSIVSSHNGHLAVKNRPERGASFSFFLPAVPIAFTGAFRRPSTWEHGLTDE
jgi:two-component system, LuxR family, sensor kinase FixL